MDEKRQEDNRYQAPWIPLTPHRPILSQPRPIYPEMQVNQPEQVNWPETEGVVPVATILGLESLPFRDLLALADASRAETSSGSLSPNFSLRLRKWVASNEIIETPQYAILSSRRPSYDLNLPPEDVSDVSDKNTAEFAPITPEKPAGGDDNHISETNISGINQEQKQAKEVVNTMPKLNKVSCNKELQDHVAESSPDAASEQNPNINKRSSHRMDQIKTASEQNLNINNRSSHRMEQIKTPQQKPKRKKHRPKVIFEGKTKKPVKPKTPKPAVSSRKRAYITEKRDKEDKPSLSTETAADSDVRTLRPKRLTRRVLDFVYDGDLEDENYSSSQQSDCMNDVQKERTASATGEAPGKRCPSIHNPLIRSGSSRNTLTEDRDEDSGRKCLTAFFVQFPNIQKKQRTNKSHSSSSSTTVLGAMKDIMGLETHDENNPHTDPSETIDNYHISAPSCTNGGPDAKGDPREGLLRGFHTSEGLTGSRKTQLFKRKRSISVTRARNMASLNRIVYCDLSPGFSEEPQTIEALISEIQSTVSRKKRTKRNLLVNHSFSTKRLQLRSGFFFRHHHPFSTPSVGTSADELWKQLYSVDAISEQFKRLVINRESTCITYQEKNAIVPYKLRNQERNALLLYKRDGVMVPSGGSFYPVKKQNPRPKVYLDDETNRVWKLLMENINNEGIDGTDEEREKWWEEERSVFSGRADSFIARMRLVQGDRSFSPWKGSVVDSVIGVFLTQNVSDHLSSSAFMSMAATFPANNTSYHEDGGSSVTHDETLKYLVDSGDTISSPLVCKQSSIIIHETNHNEETDRVDCDQTSRTYRSSSSSTNKSMYMLASPVENALGTDPEERQSKTEAELNNITFFRRRRRPMHIPTQIFVKSQDSYNSSPSPIADATGLCSGSNSDGEDICRSPRSNGLDARSLTELPQMSGVTMLQGRENLIISSNPTLIDGLTATESNNDIRYMDNQIDRSSTQGISNISYGSRSIPDQVVFDAEISKSWQERLKSDKDKSQPSYREAEEVSVQSQSETCVAPRTITQAQDNGEKNKTKQHTSLENQLREILDITESTISHDYEGKNQYQTAELNVKKQCHAYNKKPNMMNATKSKGQPMKKQKTNDFDWDSLRRDTESDGHKRERTARTRDSVDWEAVRCADVDEIAKTIRARGMNNMLAERIKAFLNRLDKEHGSIDLEWLRDVPPDKAKEYLLSIRGLGLKSVECVRLLTLHHLAFPVDTNVGRIAVRLGWVPLQPLPESLQLHLLELYPVLESIQKYLWPRLCKLDLRTLYELHYQMISFGKVFCTKSKPNCNACPMRGECRHFASAFASARLALPGPEERRIISANERTYDPEPAMAHTLQQLFLPQATRQPHGEKSQNAKASAVNINLEANDEVNNTEPIIEEPATPEPECTQVSEYDIEDAFYEDTDEIPTIKLNMEAFSQNLQTYMLRNMELQEADVSNALVALSAEAASIPMPKLKNMSRLRTEHQVYELPDSHPLLEGFDKREPDDPCSYLLAIWTPGETANSIEQPEKRCSSQGSSILCQEETCLSCNSVREAESQIVRGTLLIPCRTAMRGSFPLNGTYFQVNEVFADNDSSLNPIDVPRNWIWNLPRRTVYFGTSVPTIFRGLTTEEIQHCFWRGYVCVRGFDQRTRAPRPLMARLHFPVSKLAKSKNRTDAENN